MPYRTQYGSHYHITYGCHGATLPCDTGGLTPCSDCCGAGANGGGGFGGTAAGTPAGAGTGTYADGAGQFAAAGGGEYGMADALRNLVASGIAPSVTTKQMPPSPPTDLLVQMLSSGMLASIDFDTRTGVMSFKMATPQQQGGATQAAASAETARADIQGVAHGAQAGQATTPEPSGPAGGGKGPTLAPSGKPRDYGRTDTTDAIREIKNGNHNSLEEHLQPDGTLTPEREALHRQIIDDVLSGKVPVDGQAIFRMLGGGPASGKSSVVKAGCVDELDEQSTVDLDSDAMKERLPGYAEATAVSSDAAAYFHEEASALTKRIMQIAFGENYNVTLDGTGNGSVRSVKSKIAKARAAGYRVTAVYVTVDIDTAIERNKERYRRAREAGKNPRLVPARVVANIHKSVSAIFPQVAEDFDEVELYDNSGPRGSKPKLIARGGAGQPARPVPGREREWDEFLHKS